MHLCLLSCKERILDNPFVIIAHVPTDSVMEGFLPELRIKGQELRLVTDQPDLYHEYIEQGVLTPNEIVAADVFNPVAIINALTQAIIIPAAIFSNSDHLQTATAIAAEFYNLPTKNWKACYRTKNKRVMRDTINASELDSVWCRSVCERSELMMPGISFPCVVKPVQGVASEHVFLAKDNQALHEYAESYWSNSPLQPLLLEEYLIGPLHTLETIGDGNEIYILGSFETALSEPPYFIELGRRFKRNLDEQDADTLLRQLKALGVGFGACHTEFIMTKDGPRLIEVNYRNIGDQSDFLIAEALEFNTFSAVIDLHLGKPIGVIPKTSKCALIRCQVAKNSGVLGFVPETQSLLKNGCQVHFHPLCVGGNFHQQDFSNRDFLSVIYATGPSEEILSLVMEECIEHFNIDVEVDSKIKHSKEVA